VGNFDEQPWGISASGVTTIRSIQLERVGLEAAGPSERHHGIDVGVTVHEGERLYAVPRTDLALIEGLARDG
jgi:hypothetical protein